MTEVKPVENINKNLRFLIKSFSQISRGQKDFLPSHKLQDHAYEQHNPFGLKEDNSSQRNRQNQLSHPSLSHIKQWQECFIQGKIHIQRNSKTSSICKAKF